MMSKTLVTVRDLHKIFQRGGERIDVLQGVTLDIPEGDFLSLMGPSGSGKTTLLNLLGGLDTPTEGSITVAADHIDKMSGAKLSAWRARHIGFVFQLYNLLPVLTAARNVELPLLLTKLGKADRRKRVEVALSVVGLSDRMHHYPRQLSGGQEDVRPSCSPSSPAAWTPARARRGRSSSPRRSTRRGRKSCPGAEPGTLRPVKFLSKRCSFAPDFHRRASRMPVE